ncbi:unnamed protein product [Chrysoparadoxa australica]
MPPLCSDTLWLASITSLFRASSLRCLFHAFLSQVSQHSAVARPWTLVTSLFTHKDWWHFARNMMTLLNVGPFIEQLLPNTGCMVGLYIGGGVVASLVSMFIGTRAQSRASRLGASGGICSFFGYMAARVGTHGQMLMMGRPVSGEVYFGLFILQEILTGMEAANSNIDVLAHISGGIVGYLLGQRRTIHR